ncbi:MAG: UDP-N-acetylglucosamine 2-epimerase (non-hydrolyzing), partial [Parcubacteria group bacterium 21-58-10]
MKKILCVFGTRPEAIKMAPVIRELKNHPEKFLVVVCVTGQHRDMLDQVLSLFDVKPDYDLNLMQTNQTLAELTSKVLLGVDSVLRKELPDWVLVQGDTTTAMAAALAAFYNKVKVGHIEAGLRTWDAHNPFPEETNRKIIDSFGDSYFAPTEVARQNLLKESVISERIFVTGNTVIDSLRLVAQKSYDWLSGPLAQVPRNKRIILATTHRRENFGLPLEHICEGLKRVAVAHDDIQIVVPVHPNPNVRKVITSALGGVRNVSLLEPLDYASLTHLLKESTLVVTDSGGLQEEAPTFGKPVLVLRETSERPEGITAGVAKIIGTNS